MVDCRDDIEQLKFEEEMEDTYFILLSLCREYSIEMLNDSINKQEYTNKLRQIKSDMKRLDKKELIHKTQLLYLPLLQQMERKHNDIRK